MRTDTNHPWLGAAAGAVGGILGSWAMVRVQHAIGPTEDARTTRDSRPHRRATASPNDSDATISDEPASRQTASWVAEAVTGQPLGERGKSIGGPIMHYGFGALAGALYGASAEVEPEMTRAGGAAFGATFWVTAVEIGLPLTGLSRSPREYPLARHATSLLSHIVFGMTVETVRRMLRGPARERAVPAA